MRGEHGHAPTSLLVCQGSSPLARGAHHGRLHRLLRPGIIPACAGSTSGTRCAPTAGRDHPRLRGEHVGMALDVGRNQGSSPLARGALLPRSSLTCSVRIIPACAGSTSARSSFLTLDMDHPRLRGEHAPGMASVSWFQGSSPLARGAQVGVRSARAHARIIPACAGSTRRTSST